MKQEIHESGPFFLFLLRCFFWQLHYSEPILLAKIANTRSRREVTAACRQNLRDASPLSFLFKKKKQQKHPNPLVADSTKKTGVLIVISSLSSLGIRCAICKHPDSLPFRLQLFNIALWVLRGYNTLGGGAFSQKKKKKWLWPTLSTAWFVVSLSQSESD